MRRWEVEPRTPVKGDVAEAGVEVADSAGQGGLNQLAVDRSTMCQVTAQAIWSPNPSGRPPQDHPRVLAPRGCVVLQLHLDNGTAQIRLDGYRQELTSAGLSWYGEVSMGLFHRSEVFRAMNELLEGPEGSAAGGHRCGGASSFP